MQETRAQVIDRLFAALPSDATFHARYALVQAYEAGYESAVLAAMQYHEQEANRGRRRRQEPEDSE